MEGGEEELPYPGLSGTRRWVSTGAGFPRSVGMGMREMPGGMGVWITASAGWEGKRSTGPKATAARGTGRSQTPGVCCAAA